MAGFLYYIPGAPSGSKSALEKCGLADVFGKADSPWFRVDRGGPDGGGGALVALKQFRPEPFKYAPEFQAWRAEPGGRYWIGYVKTDPPRPEQLQRREFIAGHPVTMEDGSVWTVPIARSFTRGMTLPQSLSLGPNGELIAESLPRFVGISAKAERVFERIRFESSMVAQGITEWPEGDAPYPPLTYSEGFQIAVESLTLNYHVNGAVLSCWPSPLLTTDNVFSAALALIDWPGLESEAAEREFNRKNDPQKKSAAAEARELSTTADGETANCPDTTQPMQTSIG